MKFILIGSLILLLSSCAPMGSGGAPETGDGEVGGSEFENPKVGGTEFENPEGGGAPPDKPGEGSPVDEEDDDPQSSAAGDVQETKIRVIV